jgi:hypothetical protein
MRKTIVMSEIGEKTVIRSKIRRKLGTKWVKVWGEMRGKMKVSEILIRVPPCPLITPGDQEEAGEEGSGHVQEDGRGGLQEVLGTVQHQHQIGGHGGRLEQNTTGQTTQVWTHTSVE